MFTTLRNWLFPRPSCLCPFCRDQIPVPEVGQHVPECADAAGIDLGIDDEPNETIERPPLEQRVTTLEATVDALASVGPEEAAPEQSGDLCFEVQTVAKNMLSVMVTHEVGGAVERVRRDLLDHILLLRSRTVEEDDLRAVKDQIATLRAENGQLLTLLIDGFKALGLEVELDGNGYTGVVRQAGAPEPKRKSRTR